MPLGRNALLLRGFLASLAALARHSCYPLAKGFRSDVIGASLRLVRMSAADDQHE